MVNVTANRVRIPTPVRRYTRAINCRLFGAWGLGLVPAHVDVIELRVHQTAPERVTVNLSAGALSDTMPCQHDLAEATKALNSPQS
jgi:hypothetical protein